MLKLPPAPISLPLFCSLAMAVVLAGTARAVDFSALPESAICVEASTGVVLQEENAGLKRPPASMIKLILMLLVAEGLDEGRWTEETPITASAEAQRMGGTQVYLEEGDTHPLGHMMKAVAVASANDAAMAVAEILWGSKEGYLKAANTRAHALGMTDTVFNSVHGLPPDDRKTFDLTTARDMSLLGRACIGHERIRAWAGLRELQFTDGQAVKYNTNKLLWRMDDCDGLKTGYIRAAGFCIAATAERDGVRLVAVVMGASSKYGRFNRAEEMLEDGFTSLERLRIIEGGAYAGMPIPVEGGRSESVRLRAEADLWALVPRNARDRVRVEADKPASLTAPMDAGTRVGELVAWLDGKVLGRCALLLPAALEPKGWYLQIDEGRAYWEGLHEAGERIGQ